MDGSPSLPSAPPAPPAPAPPKISSIEDVEEFVESRNPTTSAFLYTTFHLFTDDDVVFFGQLPKLKADLTVQEIADALEPVPDHIIFPPVPSDMEILVAPDEAECERFIKRPDMGEYDLYHEDSFLARILWSELVTMQTIAQHPHPNIVRYHGARLRRGRVTGLVLDKHQHTLWDHVTRGLGLDRTAFMDRLESAVAHLHSLGLAHNDLHPENVMVGPDKMPVLIDFGSCGPFGKRLFTAGTPGWTDELDGRSGKGHDTFGLNKIHEWMREKVA